MMVGSSIGSVVLLSGAGGCLPEAPEGSGVEYRVDDDDGSIPAHNRTADGVGYVNNGLHDPDVGGFDPAYPLYMVEGLDGSRLTDPDRLFTAVYAVECALGPDQSVTKIVDGETVSW